MVAIIDYGMGNLGSIQNMFARIGAESVITADPALIGSAAKLVLPGVGAFDSAILNLRKLGLVRVLNEAVLERRVPILGICLGVQLFSHSSEEGTLPGLGWIDAETVRFRFEDQARDLKVPHMGWNTVAVRRAGSVLDNLPADARFYFVHSYHVRVRDSAQVLATTQYGVSFHSAVVKDNIVGTQFHPEKSHRFGLHVMRNFVGSAR